MRRTLVASLPFVIAACGHDGPILSHSDAVGAMRPAKVNPAPAGESATSSQEGALSADGPLAAGARVFTHTCTTCHQPSGAGMPNAFPPLAGSDFLLADKGRSIGIVLNGLSGPITVNGNAYAAAMPSHGFLSDDDIANVLTFVRNSWGNRGEPVTAAEVAAKRQTAAR